jgi:hypothetical protein
MTEIKWEGNRPLGERGSNILYLDDENNNNFETKKMDKTKQGTINVDNKQTSKQQQQQQNRLLIMFGYYKYARTNGVFVFDIVSKLWSTPILKKISGNWEPRSIASCCLKGKFVYIFGK